MSSLHDILQSIHGLSAADQAAIFNVLKAENLNPPMPAASARPNPLIGLLADEPQLADAILESAMAARDARPCAASLHAG